MQQKALTSEQDYIELELQIISKRLKKTLKYTY